MAVSVYTSLSYICETRPRGEKNQGVEFEPIEAGYHPVLFICVHRSQRHVSNKLSEINFQFNIAPSRLWRSAFWEGPDQSSLPPNNRNLGWPSGQNGGEVRAGWADSGEMCDPLCACATQTACVTYSACITPPFLSIFLVVMCLILFLS